MAFRDRNLNFEEADRRYAELVRKRQSGSINEREFDTERKRLMVLDKQGRWWAKSAVTGEWNYHDGKAWVRGVPPGYRPPAGGADAKDAPGSRAESRRSDSPYSKSPPQEVDEDEQRTSRVPFLGLILVAGLLVLGLLGWGAYTLTRDTVEGDTVENVKVPDLAGAASLEEARRMAGEDFEVVEGEKVESRKPIGTVLGQDPAAGEMAEPSSSISVDLSKGVNLPNLKGEPREKAIRILAEKGFQVEGKFKKSSAEDKDRVIGQDPPGGEGESVEAGTAVEITIGTGPAGTQSGTSVDDATAADGSSPGPTQIPVPDVVGSTAVEAAQTLENAGFTYDVQTVQSYEPAGTVVSTDPGPGTPLDPASRSVIINQSSGPPAAEEPAPGTSPPTYTEPPYTEPASPDPASPDQSSPDPSSPEASPGPTDEGS
jgi:beta-lactam-binding protein with PASTA domain